MNSFIPRHRCIHIIAVYIVREILVQIPLMENKMKWDRPKKKKHPVIEIEMSSADHVGQTAEEGTSAVPTFQVQWSSKQDVSSPSSGRRFQDHGINLHSGDSGIESVQVSDTVETKI